MTKVIPIKKVALKLFRLQYKYLDTPIMLKVVQTALMVVDHK